ncbi:MAG: putative oxygen-independent coproporphyrinogen III oxidase [Candidatus Azotimanducaceae bacterium]
MPNIPLSLYVHFPWCERKCPYCDFNSHEIDTIPEAQYLDRLIEDLETEAKKETRTNLISIFMGGGTPSLFSPEAIHRLLDTVKRHFDITGTEITMEANPGTFDQSHFDGYAQAGVNRLSIGAQSFSDTALERLGRIHGSADIGAAVTGLHKAGFEKFNIDLMHGLPEQSHAEALDDLAEAAELGASHISWYQLTIEPNTVFYNRPPVLPDENILIDISERGAAFLESQGFSRYEISAWSKPGEEARHNINYWEFGDYLGIGAGAHGKVTREGVVYRTTKTRLPKDYLGGGRFSEVKVNEDELVLEYLMNALRLTSGFYFDDFVQRTGLPLARLDQFVEKAEKQQLIEIDQVGLRPTAKGQQFLDSLLLLAD